MYKVLSIVLVLSLLPQFVSAAGIEVRPEKFEVQIQREQSHSDRLVVTNPFDQEQEFRVYADNYRDVISIRPDEFTLPPGQSKEVNVVFRPTYASIGNSRKTHADISVVATPVNANTLKASVGVKVPVDITVIKSTNRDTRFELLVSTIVFLGSLGLWSLRPKQSRK